MASVADRVQVETATTGTGTITLGSPVDGWFDFSEGGIADGDVVTCVIVDGNDFEVVTGTYTASGTTFSRDTVHSSLVSGTAGTSKLNLSGSGVTVFVTARAGYLRSRPFAASLLFGG